MLPNADANSWKTVKSSTGVKDYNCTISFSSFRNDSTDSVTLSEMAKQEISSTTNTTKPQLLTYYCPLIYLRSSQRCLWNVSKQTALSYDGSPFILTREITSDEAEKKFMPPEMHPDNSSPTCPAQKHKVDSENPVIFLFLSTGM